MLPGEQVRSCPCGPPCATVGGMNTTTDPRPVATTSDCLGQRVMVGTMLTDHYGNTQRVLGVDPVTRWVELTTTRGVTTTVSNPRERLAGYRAVHDRIPTVGDTVMWREDYVYVPFLGTVTGVEGDRFVVEPHRLVTRQSRGGYRVDADQMTVLVPDTEHLRSGRAS